MLQIGLDFNPFIHIILIFPQTEFFPKCYICVCTNIKTRLLSTITNPRLNRFMQLKSITQSEILIQQNVRAIFVAEWLYPYVPKFAFIYLHCYLNQRGVFFWYL